MYEKSASSKRWRAKVDGQNKRAADAENDEPCTKTTKWTKDLNANTQRKINNKGIGQKQKQNE